MKCMLLATAICVVAIPFCLRSQEFRGTVSGLVADPSSSPVAGARVTITETHTGTKLETVSNASGEYTAPFLSPGDYDIEVQAQGFKRFVRKAVHVGAGDHPVIDIPLQLGDAIQ